MTDASSPVRPQKDWVLQTNIARETGISPQAVEDIAILLKQKYPKAVAEGQETISVRNIHIQTAHVKIEGNQRNARFNSRQFLQVHRDALPAIAQYNMKAPAPQAPGSRIAPDSDHLKSTGAARGKD